MIWGLPTQFLLEVSKNFSREFSKLAAANWLGLILPRF
jgi:hypothetical protein